MKRVIIVHGWGDDPNKRWIPWLKSELEKMGYAVAAPAMPNTDTPEIKAWVNCLAEVTGDPDKDTYFIGHSVGCQTILRYLETIKQPVGGAVFVAGWFNVENLEDVESERIVESWIKTPVDISRIKKVLPKSILIISKDDPYGAFRENVDEFSKFVSHVAVLPNAGHINKLEEQEILSQFMNLVQ
jgi:predicted alpha/beta hydrolase family esterase